MTMYAPLVLFRMLVAVLVAAACQGKEKAPSHSSMYIVKTLKD